MTDSSVNQLALSEHMMWEVYKTRLVSSTACHLFFENKFH